MAPLGSEPVTNCFAALFLTEVGKEEGGSNGARTSCHIPKQLFFANSAFQDQRKRMSSITLAAKKREFGEAHSARARAQHYAQKKQGC